MKQPVLIFDFGNVVCFFDYLKACEPIGRRLGLTGPELRARLQQRGFAELMVRFESGRIEPREFAGDVMRRAGLELAFDEFVRSWVDIFWLNQSIARLLDLLDSRGYRLLLGSNTNILHSTHFRREFAPTIHRFDHLILSHEVGCLKPDRRFYEACVAASGVPASSCIFIDDVRENVEGAAKAGLIALQYVDTAKLESELCRLGVEIVPGEG
jgi:putative hydrolase of the HAD superfamily